MKQQRNLSAKENGTALEWIALHWPSLPPHVREALLTLVDGALAIQAGASGEGDKEGSIQSKHPGVGT